MLINVPPLANQQILGVGGSVVSRRTVGSIPGPIIEANIDPLGMIHYELQPNVPLKLITGSSAGYTPGWHHVVFAFVGVLDVGVWADGVQEQLRGGVQHGHIRRRRGVRIERALAQLAHPALTHTHPHRHCRHPSLRQHHSGLLGAGHHILSGPRGVTSSWTHVPSIIQCSR